MSELASSTNHMACLLGMSKDAPYFSGLSSIDVKVKSMWPPVRHTSFKRGGVWNLSATLCYLYSICIDSIIPCPGVIDKEGADTIGVHSSQTIKFRMMITMTHFFHGIQEVTCIHSTRIQASQRH